jgi:hypothetical protein
MRARTPPVTRAIRTTSGLIICNAHVPLPSDVERQLLSEDD